MNKHPWVEAERKFYENKLDGLIHELDFSSCKTILDYGTGTGGFASLLAEKYPKLNVLAVDSNPQAISLAKENYSHLPNLKFKILRKIPKGRFDLIFFNLVLHELNGKEDKKIISFYLNEAYKRIKSGGKISVLDNRRVSKQNFMKVYDKNKSPNKQSFEEEYEEHNKYTMKDWKEILEKAGFKTEYRKKISPNLWIYHGIKK